MYKFGITDDPNKRLTALQNGDKCSGGYYIKTIDVYESRCSERILHQAFDLFKLRHSGEWFKVDSDDRAIKILEEVTIGLNSMYDSISCVPEAIANCIDEKIRELGGEPQQLPLIEPIPEVNKSELLRNYAKKLHDAAGDSGMYKTKLEQKIKELNKDESFINIKKELPRNLDDLESKKDSMNINLNIDNIGNKKLVKVILEFEE